ncbi:MAG: hypothetical protein Q7U14_12170, partial [Lacisediminimonas sp.]|nr:hypothetical protein [Lacisediminimonas sp.]
MLTFAGWQFGQRRQVAISSSTRKKPFWRTDWFTGALVVAVVTVLHLTTDLVGALERRLYDVASTIVSPQPAGLLAVIAIDEQSIARLGHCP